MLLIFKRNSKLKGLIITYQNLHEIIDILI
jgi:hypothetical protein